MRDRVPAPLNPPESGMLLGGTHLLSGKVVDARGRAIACSITVWCARSGTWPDLRKADALTNSLLTATPDGTFSVLVNPPGVYGPRYLEPHVNLLLSFPGLGSKRHCTVVVPPHSAASQVVIRV